MATLPDYSIDVAQPFTEALKGYQLGMGFEEAKQKSIMQQQQAQQILQQQQALQDAQRLVSQNPNAENYSKLMTLDPKSSEAYQRAWSTRNVQQQETLAADLLKQGAAITSGRPEIAAQYLEDKATAIETQNNGQPTAESQSARTQARIMKEHPEFALGQIQALLAVNPQGKTAAETLAKFGEESRAKAKAPFELTEAKAKAGTAKSESDIKATEALFAERLQAAGLTEKNWNVKNLQSQIGDRSARLNLDQQTTAATVAEKMSSIQKNLNDIPADTRKLINESATLAATSKQSANQMNDLAKRIEGLGGYGAAARLGEFAKSTIGAEGYETSLRQEYTRLRNQAAIKSLPPGPATDKDIEMALKGFPKDTSDSRLVASFLRGMAKLQDIDSSINNAKTDWLAQNNGALTRARGTFVAGDYAAKPGETFNDFSQRIVGDVSKRYAPGTQSALAEQIPTDKTPRPAAVQNNIRSQADAILSGGR